MARLIEARVIQKAGTIEELNNSDLKYYDGEQVFVKSDVDDNVISYKVGANGKKFNELPYPDFYAKGKVTPASVFTGLPSGVYIPTLNGLYNGTVTVNLGEGYQVLHWDGTTLEKVVYPIDFTSVVYGGIIDDSADLSNPTEPIWYIASAGEYNTVPPTTLSTTSILTWDGVQWSHIPFDLEVRGEFLVADTMDEMRSITPQVAQLLVNGTYKGVTLLGYYVKGDTPAPIEYYLSDTTDEDDGGSVIEVADIKLEHIFKEDIDIRYFGSKSDGVFNDLDAYYRVCIHANSNKVRVIVSKDLLFQTTTSFSMGGAPTLGVNRPKVIVDGNIQFNVTNVLNMELTNIDFILKNNWGTNLVNHNCRPIFLSSKTTPTRTIRYTNLTCYAEVPVEDGTYRANTFIEENGVKGGIISDIKTWNMHRSIRTDYIVGGMSSTSYGLNIRNLTFFNGGLGLGNNTWHTSIENIEMINTAEQSKNFLLKDVPPAKAPAGLDCVLSTGAYTTYRNIRAINPIERCIYVQASNVYAENLYAENGDGFKFVGYNKDMIMENIRLFNTTWIINDNYANLQKFMSHSQFYFVRNVWVEDVKIINNTSAANAFLMEFGSFRDYAENITIKNVEHIGSPMAVGFTRFALPSVPIDESYIVYKNIRIEDVKYSVNRNKVNGTILRTGDQTGVPLNSWTGYTLADTIAQNVTIKNVKVDNTQRQDKSLYYYRGIDGFFAEGNETAVPMEHISGFIDPTLAGELNNQSKNIVIKDKYKTININEAFNVTQVFKFKENTEIIFEDISTNANLKIDNFRDSTIQNNSVKMWKPSKKVNSSLTIGNTHNAIVEVDSSFGKYVGEIRLGVLTDKVGSNLPTNYITWDNTTKTIGVNSFSADRIMDTKIKLFSDMSPFKIIPVTTSGAYINTVGNGTASANYSNTSFVDLKGASTVEYNGQFGNDGSRIAFYSNNGAAAFIPPAFPEINRNITNEVITIPVGARFARFSIHNSQLNNFWIILRDSNGNILG